MRAKVFIILFLSVLLVECDKKSNIVAPIEYDYTVETSEDPNAPEIRDEWEEWILENAHPINSIRSEEFSDLQFMKPLLDQKRIVQLGESSHGVKEFNRAKVRLIKFLHEEMGFNVLAFESSVFDCFYGYNREIDKGPLNTMRSSIFGVWHTHEVMELFEYLVETQSTENPLILTGFDIQPSGYGRYFRPEFLESVFSKIDSTLAEEIFEFDTHFLDIVGNEDTLSQFESLKDRYQYFLDQLIANWDLVMSQYQDNQKIPHIARLTLLSNIKHIDYLDAYANDKSMITPIRDTSMAENFDYLAKEVYPDEKMIVWAHNFHIRHNNAAVESPYFEKQQTMGHYIHEIYGDELYTVGFYMYRGEVAMNNRQIIPVTPSASDNIEAILYRKRKYFCFVDMLNEQEEPGNSWMFQKMKAKYWGSGDQLMIPRVQYDGIFYVDETSPPSYY